MISEYIVDLFYPIVDGKSIEKVGRSDLIGWTAY
jgi:hypothetical protein